MPRILLVVFVLMCSLFPLFAQNESIRIVVFDLTAKSSDVKADSSMLSEMLRNEFIKTGRFEVVSREQTAKIMSEAEFQTTGFTNADDAIQVGKLLNVKRAIVGSVGTLGGTVFVTVQLFDLETGRFVTAESMEAPTMKDIVSRMKSTVGILADASYRVEGGGKAGPAAAAAPVEPTKPAPVLPATKVPPRGGPSALNYLGYGAIVLGLGAAAAGYFYFNAEAAKAYDGAVSAKYAYDHASTNFDALWANYTSAYGKIAPLTTGRLICYIGGGALAAGGIVMAILRSPAPKQSRADGAAGWRIAALPTGVLVSLSY